MVDLVASVDTEQQAQSRYTYHVQKTTNATEINTRTTRNYGLGDLSTQLLKISWLLKATDSSQCFLMSGEGTGLIDNGVVSVTLCTGSSEGEAEGIGPLGSSPDSHCQVGKGSLMKQVCSGH